MNAKYFKTLCIIMVVVGVVNIGNTILSLTGGTLGVLSVIMNILSGALTLFAGVIGIKAVKDGDEDKAALCRKVSYVYLAIAVVGAAIGAFTNRGVTAPGMSEGFMTGMLIVISIISLIIPVLYFLGAKKLGE